MWLQSGGRAAHDGDVFLQGVAASEVLRTDAGQFVLAATRSGGGVMAFRVEADGRLTVTDSRIFSDIVAPVLTGKLAVAEMPTGPVLFVGAGVDQMVGYRIGVDGSIGARVSVDRATVFGEIAGGNDAMLRAWALHSDTVPLPEGAWQTSTIGLEVSGAHVLAIGAFDDHIAMMPRAGAWDMTLFGAEQGLGIAAPTAMELVETAQGQWAVLAAAGSASLSVLEVTAEGGVRPTDHVIDTRHTRFDDVQALASARWGDEALIVAGGGDHGLTLFRLSPDGRLVWLDTLVHATGDGLYNISALSAVVVDQTLVITAGSQRDAGLSSVTVTLADLGLSGHVATGGAGHDLLISSPANLTLTGGAGADIFALRQHDAPVEITDFQVGVDRLDLSDWPMLRDVAQLDITPTGQGALISYRDFSVHVRSDSGAPLTAAELFPHGLQGPDRMLVLNDSDVAGEDSPPDADPGPQPPAPDPGTDAGFSVVDRAGQGLADVTVTLAPTVGTPVLSQSDAQGRFSLPPAPEGALSLTRFHTGADPAITASDALDILRLAVGLDAWAGPQDFIAADIDRNGRVTASDALEVLRIAVGLTPDTPPEWVFIDSAADLGAITAQSVQYQTGYQFDGAEVGDLTFTGILLGNMDG